MCTNNKRRNVELDVTYKLVSVYDPEYFELKQKYEELCKAVLEYICSSSFKLSPISALQLQLEDRLIKLAKGE